MRAAPLLILAAASVALFAPWLGSGHPFLGVSPASAPPWVRTGPDPYPSDASASDALAVTWPNLVHWMHSVRTDWRGILWNPLTCCGSPFLGSQIGFPLYPSNLVAIAGGATAFFLWSPLLHVVLANVGAYLALRRLGLSKPACMLGAWSFGAGSWFLAHLAIVNFVQAAAWLPWIAFSADRAQVLRRPRDRLLLGACVALSIFAGMIQVTLISLLLAAVLMRARAEEHARAGSPAGAPWRGVVSVSAGVALGLLLAAPQLLPLAEWSRDSSRMRTPAEAGRNVSVRPLEWAHLLVPEILGSPTQISRLTGAGEAGPSLKPVDEASYPPARLAGARGVGATFLESVCSPLAAGLVLALASLRGRRRAVCLFLGIVAGGALLAMDTPFQRAIASLPGGGAASPRRFLLLSAAGFAALAALGAERLLQVGRTRILPWIPACLVGGWLGMNVAVPGAVSRALAAAGASQADVMPAIFRDQAIEPFVALLLAAIAATFARGRVAIAVLAVVAGADAFLFQTRNHPLRPPEPVFPPTEATRFLEARMRDPLSPAPGTAVIVEDPTLPRTRVARFKSRDESIPPPIPPNTGMVLSLRDLQGYGGVLPRRIEELLDAVEPGIVLDHEGIGAWRNPGSFELPLLRFLGVRHVLAADHEIPNLVTLRQFRSERCSVFENPGAAPRVTALSRARVFGEEDAMLRALAAPGFDPSQALLLDSDAAALGLPRETGPAIELPAAVPGESVRWTQIGAGEAAVEASVRAPRILVVAETWHPGWRAEDAEGRRHPVVRANHGFQAILLPAGDTRLRVVFAPESFTIGIWALAFGLIAALADMILGRCSRRGAA